MIDYQQHLLKLEKQFSGVKNPEEMGTTGLVGWVCVASGIRLYRRFRQARRIIRERTGEKGVAGFVRACVASAPTQYRKERILHYAS